MSGDRRRDARGDGFGIGRDGRGRVLEELRWVLASLAVATVAGLFLFAIGGAWPPVTAVESGSMEPNLHRGDLVFVVAPDRTASEAAVGETGVVPAERARRVDYRSLGGYGSVLVYAPAGDIGSPVVHRARFWVSEGENWYGRASPEHVRADGCRELANCPAPRAGFVTKGDANRLYDQAAGISGPVPPERIVGVARARIPSLGWIRLLLEAGFRAALA